MRFSISRISRRRLLSAGAVLAAGCMALATAGPAFSQQAQGVSDTEIVIGVLTDFSGPVASVGAPQRDGMLLAAEEINEAGGIHGRKVRLVFEDTAYDPRKAVLGAQKLALRDRVFAVIGTLGSATLIASDAILSPHGIPHLFPMTGTPQSHEPLSDLKFGLLGLASDGMRVAIKYAHDELGRRRFGILYQDDELGLAGLHTAEEQLKVHGLKLVERTSFKRGDVNFSAQVARLRAADVDLVLLVMSPREVAAIAIEVNTQGWPVDLLSTMTATQPIITLAGQAAEGAYGITGFVGAAQEITPEYEAMLERFRSRFGRELTDGVNYGYLSMMLFAEGARNAGQDLSAHSLARGLEEVKDFTTVFEAPPVSYAPGNHAPPPEAFILQVQDGKWVKVAGPIGY